MVDVPGGNIGYVDVTRCHTEHQLFGVIDAVTKVMAVQQTEGARRGPGEPLVSVYQRVIARQRVEERRGLVGECWVGVLAENRGSRPRCGRSKQTYVTDENLAEYAGCDL